MKMIQDPDGYCPFCGEPALQDIEILDAADEVSVIYTRCENCDRTFDVRTPKFPEGEFE